MKKLLIIIILFPLIFVAYEFFLVTSQKTENKVPQDTKILNKETGDPVQMLNVSNDEIIQSSLQLKGKAYGYWFFEGSFPIEIQGADRRILGRGIARANGEWMTEQLVPFSASVEFFENGAENGYIVFKKDNPSGDPARDDKFEIPIRF